MAAGPPAPEERRIVTLLAADLVGSTALGEGLDPEETRLVVGDAVARMVTAVEQLGGTVKDLAGDGIFALFGAPTAHDDDPERAVQAGLRIAEAIAAHSADVEKGWGLGGLGVRVGIATGTVVVGPIGAGGRVEYGATGDAANTAARLQGTAEPASVLVDEATRRLVEHLFEWGEPRSLSLKGKNERVLAVPVIARAGSDRRRHRLDAPLVGRERELALARETLAGVLAGAGGVLFLTGEPGVGKSRLLTELRREFASSASPGGRPLWLEGRAASYGDATPYAPFQHLLREWLDIAAGQPELRARIALRRAIEALFGTDAPAVEPSLATLLGLGADVEPVERNPQAVRRKIFEAVERLLARLARDGPVVVALDDLQWADSSSLELAAHLLDLPDREPLLLVFAQRVERAHASWQLREHAFREAPHRTRELSLVPLAEEAGADLLDALVGHATLTLGVRSRLLAAAGGNPFFLEELVCSLQDAGALVRDDEGWRLDREVEFTIPESVQSVVLARLDRLPPRSRTLLSAASVLGLQVSLPLLEAVAGSDDQSLRDLQRLDLLRETRRWPEREFGFKHPLIQETAYRSLVGERRRELHARAAAAVAEVFADRADEHAAILAHHTLAAGQLEEALGHLQTAAAAAARVYATDEALDHYSRALEVARQIEAGAAVIAELHLGRGLVAYRSGRFVFARADYDVALRLARAAALRALELHALEEIGWLLLVGGARIRDAIARLEDALLIAHELDDQVALVTIRSRLAIAHSHELRFEEADRNSREALRLAREVGDDGLLATALDSAKTVAVYLGDFPALRTIQGELGDILLRLDDSWYLQWSLFESALPAIGEGSWRQAHATIDSALDLNRRIGDRANEPYFIAALGWLHRASGSYREALEHGRRAVELATTLDHRSSWIVWSETLLAWTLIELHAFTEATEHLSRALEGAEQVAAPLYVFRCVARLADARLGRGDLDGASATADRAERMLSGLSTPPGKVFLHGADAIIAVASVRAHQGATEHAASLVAPLVLAAGRSGWQEPVAAGSRLLAELRGGAGDHEGAERHLRHGLAAAENGSLPGEQWRLHAALAGVLLERRRAPEAATHLETADELIERLAAGLDDDTVRRAFRDGAGATLAPLRRWASRADR